MQGHIIGRVTTPLKDLIHIDIQRFFKILLYAVYLLVDSHETGINIHKMWVDRQIDRQLMYYAQSTAKVVFFLNLFIHILNTLHIQAKTHHQSLKKKKNHYTNTQINQQINNTDKQTDRWTISHSSACNWYRFVFVSLHVPVCASVRAVCITKHY